MEYREILQLRVRARVARERSESLQLFKAEVGNPLRVKSNEESFLNAHSPPLYASSLAFEGKKKKKKINKAL